MRDWWPRIVIVSVLIVVIGLPLWLRPRDHAISAPSAAGPMPRLVIISPHTEAIRFEFGQGFNRWRQSRALPPVEFDWRSSDGTAGLRRQVLAEFEKAALRGQEDQGIGYDLFFGGGDIEHDTLARGIKIQRNGQPVQIHVTAPVQLPEGFLEQVFPQPEIGGLRLYHPEKRWMGAALSSFGIVYNRDLLRSLKLPEPQTWDQLQDPAYLRMMALGDPGHSGSVGATYNIILRRSGWTEGWMLLRRVYANARYFTASAGKVPVDVSAGEAAAGMCIDFYGRLQAGAVGGNRVGYVDPPYQTAINADPITILRGAPSQLQAAALGLPDGEGLANEFVLWLLSKDGQGLWQRRLGDPDGPRRFELRRLPVRKDMYEPAEMARWVDGKVNPFEIARPLPAGMPDFYMAVAPVTAALGIDVHDDLQQAWRAIQATAPDDPRRAKMLALFDAMPPELTLQWPDETLATNWRTILEDPAHPRRSQVVKAMNDFWKNLGQRTGNWRDRKAVLELRLQWTRFFRANYQQVAAMGRSGD